MQDPNMRRLKRPQLPNQVYMGASLGAPAVQQSVPDTAGSKALEVENRQLKGEVEALKKKLDAQTDLIASESTSKIQLTLELDTVKKRLKDAEAAQPPASLPYNRVVVTSIQERATDDGNAVVTCTMHFGDEAKAIDGTIVIPTSELGKLRNRNANQ